MWSGPVIHLITGLGMCLATCQQIEYYIAHSFLLGISKKQKQQYKTIKDLSNGCFASIDFALHHWGRPKEIPKSAFSRREKKEVSLFFDFFTPKEGAI